MSRLPFSSSTIVAAAIMAPLLMSMTSATSAVNMAPEVFPWVCTHTLTGSKPTTNQDPSRYEKTDITVTYPPFARTPTVRNKTIGTGVKVWESSFTWALLVGGTIFSADEIQITHTFTNDPTTTTRTFFVDVQ